ncbi:CBS domain-containing protein [Oceanobacillus kapialis]|uniref:CBS domain-containing protein n=1 Tax=Oceanobacillus kapialis TaxID=481353 RepID=A0ABW5Q4Q7_9BACI
MIIEDFMIRDVISVKKETTIKELLEKLVQHKITGVPVVDEEGKLLGMATDGDVIRDIQPKGRTVYDIFSLILVSEQADLKDRLRYSLDRQVKEIMQKNVVTVKPKSPIDDAMAVFSKHHIKKIPVVNPANRVVGVISRGDLIRYITTKLIDQTVDKL